MKILKFVASILILVCAITFTIVRFRKGNDDDQSYMMGPPWLLYSDERLIDEFSEAALNGRSERVVIRTVEMERIEANQILYESLYLSNGDFSKAKPYLEKAASLGDPRAKEILKDPIGYYREFRRRNLGESAPSALKLK